MIIIKNIDESQKCKCNVDLFLTSFTRNQNFNMIANKSLKSNFENSPIYILYDFETCPNSFIEIFIEFLDTMILRRKCKNL